MKRSGQHEVGWAKSWRSPGTQSSASYLGTSGPRAPTHSPRRGILLVQLETGTFHYWSWLKTDTSLASRSPHCELQGIKGLLLGMDKH